MRKLKTTESKKSGSKEKTTRKIWTKKDDSTLLKMSKQGSNSREIAEALNRTVASVWTRLWSLRKGTKNNSKNVLVVEKIQNKPLKRIKNQPLESKSNKFDDLDVLKKIAKERGVTITVSISA
jgi:hypothetical protein